MGCMQTKPATNDNHGAGGAPQQTAGKPLPPNAKKIKTGASDWKSLTANVLDRPHEDVSEFVSQGMGGGHPQGAAPLAAPGGKHTTNSAEFSRREGAFERCPRA